MIFGRCDFPEGGRYADLPVVGWGRVLTNPKVCAEWYVHCRVWRHHFFGAVHRSTGCLGDGKPWWGWRARHYKALGTQNGA